MQTQQKLERAILGALLQGDEYSREAIEKAAETLDPTYLECPQHRRILQAILDHHRCGETVNVVTIAASLPDLSAHVGGLLVDNLPMASEVPTYARMIRDRATIRRGKEAADHLFRRAEEGSLSAADMVAGLMGELGALASGAANSTFKPIPASELAAQAPNEPPWLLRGLIAAGRVTILAAPAKTGKTTLLAHAARALSGGGRFLGEKVGQASVLWLAFDEHSQDVGTRFRSLGIGPNVWAVVDPLMRADLATLNLVQRYIKDHPGPWCIVVDTLSAAMCVQDENDSRQVEAAIRPFVALGH
jgi:hypothetical protein